jgi:signal transduction histidine kinase
VFLSGAAHSFEEAVTTPQGIKTYLTTKTPWLDESGSVQGVIGIAHDITSRKAMETELKHKTEELEEKNRLITDFFINISHEFKTPLSIIVLLTDMMDQETKSTNGESRDRAQFVNMLRMNAYRLRRLVANLLDITKLDAGFMEPHWEQVDVVALLKSIVLSTDVYCKQKGLTLHFTGSMDQLFMSCDSLMLERIFLNLLSNAIKHTSSGGAIHVDLKTAQDKITITVTDNGEGIPDEKKSVIFDRFRQVNTSLSRSSEGCGIGLSITKALTELMGGSIAFKSSLGAGSTFYVTLPILHVADAGYAADYSGMGLESLVQMELSDIDFG